MKQNLRALMFALMGLALFSCDKSKPLSPKPDDVTKAKSYFSLNGALTSLEVQSAPNVNSGADEDELRAALRFNGLNNVTTTILRPTDFPALKARWGVISEEPASATGFSYFAENCGSVTTEEPKNPALLTQSIVYFKQDGAPNSIKGDVLKMYCQDNLDKSKIRYAWMCLDGAEGGTSQVDKTKQYFMNGSFNTSPNHRIEPVLEGEMQEGRHIPIMTDVMTFPSFQKVAIAAQPQFKPRGSLFGIMLKNFIGQDMLVTAIVVEKDQAFDFSGYFDWSAKGTPPFIAEYTAAENSQTALVFPVYKDNTSSETGYLVSKENSVVPTFFVWGFQKANYTKPKLRFQIRYKLDPSSTEEFTTRAFHIYPPTGSEFKDGYAYNTSIIVNAANLSGGSNGTDWKDDGVQVPNVTPNPYYPHSISLGFTTPLDFVAEAPAMNKKGTGFVLHHELPEGDVPNDMKATDAGYFHWYETLKRFYPNFLVGNNIYYLPSKDNWKSIACQSSANNSAAAPHLTFNQPHPISELTEVSHIGGEPSAKSYRHKFITVQEGSKFVTYALRFIDDAKWISAWRYSSEDIGIVIKCVPLKGVNIVDENSYLTNTVANPNFFVDNACSVRTFPFYGWWKEYTGEEYKLMYKGSMLYIWSSVRNPDYWGYYLIGSASGIGVASGLAKEPRKQYWATTVRPFIRP